MADIAKSDMFFFITSVAIVSLSIIFAAVLVYVFLILRNVKGIVDSFKEESAEMIEDIKELRAKLREKESLVGRGSAVFFFFKNLFGKSSRKQKK